MSLSLPAKSTSLLKATATDLPKENKRKAVAIENTVMKVLIDFRLIPDFTIIQNFISPPLEHPLLLNSRLDMPELLQK